MRIAVVMVSYTLAILAAGGSGATADDKAEAEKELQKFQGTWTFESVQAGGKELPAAGFKGMTVVFEGDKYSVKNSDQVVEAARLKLDPSQSPKAFDSTVTEGPNRGTVILAIYEISGDTLQVCFDPEGKKRPTEFKAESGSQTLVVHKRVKK